MDIDYFKAVNDTHGHDIGDEVLREFANRIAANVRGIDLACRYGGEEFVVVMPDTDVAFAYHDRRTPAQEHRDDADRDQPRAGQAQHHDQHRHRGDRKATDDTAEALLHRADQALYSAKRNGRNRVVADAA